LKISKTILKSKGLLKYVSRVKLLFKDLIRKEKEHHFIQKKSKKNSRKRGWKLQKNSSLDLLKNIRFMLLLKGTIYMKWKIENQD